MQMGEVFRNRTQCQTIRVGHSRNSCLNKVGCVGEPQKHSYKYMLIRTSVTALVDLEAPCPTKALHREAPFFLTNMTQETSIHIGVTHSGRNVPLPWGGYPPRSSFAPYDRPTCTGPLMASSLGQTSNLGERALSVSHPFGALSRAPFFIFKILYNPSYV